MDAKPAPGRRDAASVSARRRRRLRASVAFWVTVSVTLVGVAATSGNGSAVPDLDFRQVGHWVYSSSLGKVFHVNGASKSVDASGDVGGGSLAGGPAVQGPGSVYVPGENGTTIEFGKSRLRVKAKLPSGVNEVPFPIEVAGGPYYVFRRSGVVQRLSPLTTIRLDGGLADPVATPDGTVWLLRQTDNAVCSLARTGTAATCTDHAPAGHRGALTVLGARPAFVDTTSSEVRLVGGDGLGAPVPLGTQVGEDAKVGPSDAAGRLPIVRPGARSLLLFDTAALTAGRTPPAPTTVRLGSADVSVPVSAGRSIALVDHGNDELLTYDPDGKAVDTAELPVGATVRLIRAQDGRVYADVEGSETTSVVVDADGSTARVPLTDPAAPGTDPSRPASPSPSAPPPQEPAPSATEQPPPAETPSPTAAPTSGPTTAPAPTATGTPDPTEDPPTGTPAPTVPPRPTGGPTTPPTVAPTGTSPRPPGGGPPAATAPGAPRDVRALVQGTGATVTWTPGAGNGAPVTAYLVTWRSAADDTVVRTARLPGTARQDAVGRLTAGVAYLASVAAENRAGRGVAAESNAVTPVQAGPGAPAGVRAAADGTDGSVTVTFRPVTGASAYVVTASNDAAARVTAAQARFAALPVGGRFTFTVAAVDARDETGPASAPSNAVVPFRPAAAPVGVQATRGDRSVALAWGTPALNGGELAGYQVSAAGVPAQTVTGRTATVGGLTPGRAYGFTVRAVTREQGGGGSVPGAAAPAVAVTAAALPTVDVVSAALAGGTTTVVADVDDGAAPMTGCQVRVGTRSFPGLACAAGRRTFTVDTGAVTGAPVVTAVGTNQVGTGAPGRGAALTGGGGACRYPADVLALGGWSLGLPGSQVVTDLGAYAKDPYFVATTDCTGVRFRAAVTDATTPGSKYPRTALRTTTTFSSTAGTHTLTVRVAVTKQPAGTPAVVVAQVHGADDDLATFRLEGGTLFLSEGDETQAHTMGGVGVGTTFEARFVVGAGKITAYLNGGSAVTIPGDFSGAYFQAGAFTQASCDNSAPCSETNYGEAVISGLSVSHTG